MKEKCWKSNVEAARETHGRGSREYLEAMDCPSSCLLLEGHAGPHQYTFDGDVSFIPCVDIRGWNIMTEGRKIGEVKHA